MRRGESERGLGSGWEWESAQWQQAEKVKVLVAQSCLTLCHPMDCSPPGSSVHRILPARVLEWAAIPFSQGLNLYFLHWQADSLPVSHPGSLEASLDCI